MLLLMQWVDIIRPIHLPIGFDIPIRLYSARHGESLANTLHIISNRDLPHQLTV
jgi:hypothetical protein